MKRKPTIESTALLLCGVWLCGLATAAGRPAAVSGPADALLAEMRAFFAGAESRHPGSEGNLAAEQAVAEAFDAGGLPSGAIRFVAPHLRTGKAELSIPGQSPIRLFPMHPTAIRPGNFVERSFEAGIVYAGKGDAADLKALQGIDLSDAIVVMEFGGGNDWLSWLRFGVRGFLFLGADRHRYADLRDKVFGSEASVPRFFVQSEDAATLRALFRERGAAIAARIDSEPSRWENVILRNPWVLIPGSHPDLRREVVVLYAPIDSNCLVPDLSYGASDAANLFLLMRLFALFRDHPPERSVLLAAVNAHTQAALGERMLAWNLLASTRGIEAVRDGAAADLRAQELMVEYYRRFDLNPPTEADQEFIELLRGLTDSTTGRHLSIKEPIVTLARRDVNSLRARQLALHRRKLDPAAKHSLSEELAHERQKYVNVLTLFNKIGIRTDLADLTGEELGILKKYIGDILDQNRRWADQNREEIARNAANTAIRDAVKGLGVKFVLALDLLWTDRRVAFSSNNPLGGAHWQHRWGINMAAAADRAAGESSGEPLFVDAITKLGGLPESHFFPGTHMGIGVFHATQATPAFAVRTPFGDHGHRFSPLDTFDNLDAQAVADIAAFLPILLREALADPHITGPTELRKATGQSGAWTVRVQTFAFDEFSASVTPDLPVPDCMVLAYKYLDGHPPLEALTCGNVVPFYAGMSDERATTTFFGVSDDGYGKLLTAAYRYDDDVGRIEYAIDAGEAETRASSTIAANAARVRLPMFRCAEIPIPVREDSTLISTLRIMTQKYRVLNGSDDATPKKFGLSGALSLTSQKGFPLLWGPALVFVPPDERVKVITHGDIVALNASAEDPHGIGYASLDEMGPDFFAAAAGDMAHLNRRRLGRLQGISDELAVQFMRRGDAALQTMEQAAHRRDHSATLNALFEAIGSHVKAYSQTAAITNDMLKAVVFYLALMLPFCFFVMKLLFKFVRIEKQMLAFALLFVTTFVVFRLIHPAFKIAEAPAAMFIAFVMGGMGLFVIKILHGRFEGEMQILFNTYVSVDTSEVGYSTVGQEAMLIGVNNMKRRRLRTAFTTATIVLVTFTMLAFTSLSKKLSPTLIRRGENAPYDGLMYTWPGNSCMDEDTARILRQAYADSAEVFVRRWILGGVWGGIRTLQVPKRLSATTGSHVLLDGVLGLSAREDGFLAPIPLICGRFFSGDDALEAVLPSAVAAPLGITPENYTEHRLRFAGTEFAIVGILNDGPFKEIRDLNQRSLLPIKEMIDQGDSTDPSNVSVEDAAAEQAGVFYVDMSTLLVLPVDTLRHFGANPYSVSVRLNSGADVWRAVDKLLTISRANKFYMAARQPFTMGEKSSADRAVSPGVYYIGEGYRTSIGGLSFLIVPLLIASTIILNTMLGSVYERKNEIAVYNAVGLNPTHIAMFFLAESFVYSVIGSVGGYLIGQILTLALTKTGLIGGINLNFSSLSVVYVILFTIAVVMLSTIYPSMVATKSAVPSGKRKWALPDNNGQTMDVAFPFIYQPDLILGVLGYLNTYFSRFTEASFGDLIAHRETKSKGSDAAGRETFRIEYRLALAPFDLGVTQHGVFLAAFDDRVHAYRVVLRIERISGQDTNWVTTNKPFLEGVRTYLLHWRNLDASEHELYVRQGQELFADEPTITAG